MHVLDGSVAPLRPEHVVVWVDGQGFGATDAEASNVPSMRGEVEVVVGGRTSRAPIDAVETEVTVRVPRHGALRVTLAPPPVPTARAGERYLVARLPEGGEAEVSRIHLAEDRRASTLELPLLPGTCSVEVRARSRRGGRPERRVRYKFEADVVAGETTERSF